MSTNAKEFLKGLMKLTKETGLIIEHPYIDYSMFVTDEDGTEYYVSYDTGQCVIRIGNAYDGEIVKFDENV